MSKHIIVDVNGVRRMVDEKDLSEPLPTKKTADLVADEIAEARIAELQEIAEALNVAVTKAELRQRLRTIERRKRGVVIT